jgi:hypothetical protein
MVDSVEIAMTITDFSLRMASPFEHGGSMLQAFLDKIAEGRLRKAEAEIAEYLRHCGRQLPAETIRQGAAVDRR